MEFCLAVRKNETLSFVGKWMKLENIILNEVIQVQKDKGCTFSLICGIQVQYKYRQNTQKYIQSVNPKVRLVEETKGRGKEGEKVNNNEIYYTCVGIRHKETS
jgi:hypothetical protein